MTESFPIVNMARLFDEAVEADRAERWDKASAHAFEGTYGDYLVGKVAKVSPPAGRARRPVLKPRRYWA